MASAAVTPATTAAGTSSATATIATAVSAAVTTVSAVACVRRTFAIEVRLIRFIRKIPTAFNHQRAAWDRLALRCGSDSTLASASLCRHLRALLFEDRFARQPDAVAFDRQHLHQHL